MTSSVNPSTRYSRSGSGPKWAKGKMASTPAEGGVTWVLATGHETWHIGAARQFDPNGIVRTGILVVSRQTGAEFAGLHPDDRIKAGIKSAPPAQDRDPPRVLLQLIAVAGQGSLEQVAKRDESRGALENAEHANRRSSC